MKQIIEMQRSYVRQLEELLDLVNESGDVQRQIRLERMLKEEKRKLSHYERLENLI